MIAMGRYVKDKFGNDKKVVFIGPCIAKKNEYKDEECRRCYRRRADIRRTQGNADKKKY